ncbi:MAG TPA: hypothetical protein VFY05_11005 [Candidatus Angelobacter sp.]|nr:hypothetical protein [Candidatus Angelobacter sp.]
MKASLTAIFVLSVSLSVAAESKPVLPAQPGHARLTATLTDADRAVSATNADLAGLHVETWSPEWKSAWTMKTVYKQQTRQEPDSVKRLATGLPPMIAQVRAAHGSFDSAFRLYKRLTLVCENMNALVEASRTYGSAQDHSKLAADYSRLLRVRNNLSSYVEQRAAAIDTRVSASDSGVNASNSGAHKDRAARKVVATKRTPELDSGR